MANGFTLKTRRTAVYINNDAAQAKPDTQFNLNGALKLVNGALLPVSAQTDKVIGIFNSLGLPKEIYPGSRPVANKSSVGYGEMANFIPGYSTDYEFVTDMTGGDALAIQNVDALTQANVSQVQVTYAAGTTGDFDGGTIFANGEQRNITSSTRASNTWTFVVDRPFSRAITLGDKVTATHLNIGQTGIKLSSAAADQGISPDKADATGGFCEIASVALSHTRPQIGVRFRNA